MKIKSLLFPAVAITLVAAVSYHIGSSKQGANSDQQSIPAADEPEHSAPSEINTVEAMSREKVVEPVISPTVSKEIEADFEQRKQKIENYYANVFRRLRENVEISLRRLDFADKAAYAHFIEQLNNTTSKSTGYTSVTGCITPYGTVTADGLHIGTTKTRVEGKPASDYELKVRELNKAADDLISEYRLDCDHFQRRRACDLSDLEKEKERTLAALHNYGTTIPEESPIQPVPPKAKGTVTGILYCDERPRTFINDEVLREGQSTNGVKVIKINQDSVELEYAGTHWTQKVNDPPSTNWP
jgi:hypothetical protein